jgi:bifunctional DNA-binding transcriptional regulator/antitoxin component of YhaV-PrlF toxin-antitoxin module
MTESFQSFGFKNRKIVSITGKRQLTIPKKFYEKLGFGKEVECFIERNTLVIRPLLLDEGEFSVEILRDLISEGYGGEELIEKFTVESRQMKGAINGLIKEGKDIAEGKKKGASMKDIFGKD